MSSANASGVVANGSSPPAEFKRSLTSGAASAFATSMRSRDRTKSGVPAGAKSASQIVTS
jgi:hypothetical protein